MLSISIASEGRFWHPVSIDMIATEPIVWKEKRRPKRRPPWLEVFAMLVSSQFRPSDSQLNAPSSL